MPRVVLGTKKATLNKTDKISCLKGVYILVGKSGQWTHKYTISDKGKICRKNKDWKWDSECQGSCSFK